jgi:hypothetical protein
MGTVDGELDGDHNGATNGELAEDLHGEELDGAVDGELARYLHGEELMRSGLGERSRQAARSGVVWGRRRGDRGSGAWGKGGMRENALSEAPRAWCEISRSLRSKVLRLMVEMPSPKPIERSI